MASPVVGFNSLERTCAPDGCSALAKVTKVTSYDACNSLRGTHNYNRLQIRIPGIFTINLQGKMGGVGRQISPYQIQHGAKQVL